MAFAFIHEWSVCLIHVQILELHSDEQNVSPDLLAGLPLMFTNCLLSN